MRLLAGSLRPEEWFTFSSPALGLVAVHAQRSETGVREIKALMLVSERIDSALMKKLSVRFLGAAINLPEVTSLPPADAQAFTDSARDLLLRHIPGDRESPAPARERLTRPDGTDPDGFYRRVADAYREVSVTTRAVAPVLAEEAGVPVATVHRWVMEARRRGFLPPSRRGKST